MKATAHDSIRANSMNILITDTKIDCNWLKHAWIIKFGDIEKNILHQKNEPVSKKMNVQNMRSILKTKKDFSNEFNEPRFCEIQRKRDWVEKENNR